MKRVKNLLSLLLFIQIIVSLSCTKEKDDIKNIEETECFTFGKEGNKWTYERLRIRNSGNDTLPLDTVVFEIINANGNIYTYDNKFSLYSHHYIDNIFGPIKSFSPLDIDTIIKCSSKKGDELKHPHEPGFVHLPHTAHQKIKSTNHPINYKNTVLECYVSQYLNTDVSQTYYVNKKHGIIKFVSTACPGGVMCKRDIYSLIDKNF